VVLKGSAVYTLPAQYISSTVVTAQITQNLLTAEAYDLMVINGDQVEAQAPESLSVFEPLSVVEAREARDVCFYDYFESGPGQWERSGEWNIVTIIPDNVRAMTDSPLGPYKNAGDYGTGITRYTTAITSPAFNLTRCITPELTFDHDYAIATVGDSQDVARVEISTNNGLTWTELMTYTGGGVFGTGVSVQDVSSPEWSDITWQEVTIDLGNYTHNIIRLRFSLEVDEGASDKGWVIDNLLVSSESGIPSIEYVFLPVIIKEE